MKPEYYIMKAKENGHVEVMNGVFLQTAEDLRSDLYDWELENWEGASPFYLTSDDGIDPIPVNGAEDLETELAKLN